jgi:hypothetical protein
MDATKKRPPAAAILVIPLAVALILTLFAWPSAKLEPRDLPVGVAGAPAVEQRLKAQGDAFEVKSYRDEGAARAAIEDREVYGAFVGTPAGPKVLTATAASPAVAQTLNHAAAENPGATVEDVVVAPRGPALASTVLPLVLAGILTGVLASVLSSSALSRAGLTITGAVLSGLVATAIAQSWLDIVGGDWLVNAGVLSLTVLAIGAMVAGLEALFGHAGAIIGALTMVLVGNPFSGVGSAPELLPEPVGGIGQLMPPGAGGNLLRSTGFFDGAAAAGPTVVLLTWALAGLAAMAVAGARGWRPAGDVLPARR